MQDFVRESSLSPPLTCNSQYLRDWNITLYILQLYECCKSWRRCTHHRPRFKAGTDAGVRHGRPHQQGHRDVDCPRKTHQTPWKQLNNPLSKTEWFCKALLHFLVVKIQCLFSTGAVNLMTAQTKLKTALIIQCHACEIKEQTINMLSEFALYWYWFKNQQKKNKHALYLLNWTQLINKEQGYNWQKSLQNPTLIQWTWQQIIQF